MKLGVSQLKSPWSTLSYLSYLIYISMCATVSYRNYSLIDAEIFVTQNSTFLRLPDSVNNILYRKTKVRLAVSSITERHQRWFCLSDWSKG